ncbi:hypothetical protein [uncultured Rikenella sp.]|uniref:hypothetical protein n=1 Tax=uncultured Rikenella sp. TaxID=368003 RepID=UPI00261A1AEE|nr:hypothetical protein [uncultured Rikenella sp.]
MKRSILFVSLLACMALAVPSFSQSQTQIENPQKALGLDTIKQIRPTDLRQPNDKNPGTLFSYKGHFYVAESVAALRQKQIIPQDPKAIIVIHVVKQSLIDVYRTKLPAKHRDIQNVALIEDWEL